MDDSTRNIVASNLTVAHYLAQGKSDSSDGEIADEVIEIYQELLNRLDDDGNTASGFVGVMPEVGSVR